MYGFMGYVILRFSVFRIILFLGCWLAKDGRKVLSPFKCLLRRCVCIGKAGYTAIEPYADSVFECFLCVRPYVRRKQGRLTPKPLNL